MKRRLVILTEIISPYRIPVFNCLAHEPGVDLHVIFLSESDPALRQWKVYKEEIRFSYEVLPSLRGRIGNYRVVLNGKVVGALRHAAPDAILCGGYNYPASWQVLMWARAQGVPFLLWSESNRHDARPGRILVEMLKAEFLRRCDAFVVPGRSAHDYLRAQKVREDRIFIAPNAVDNDLFASGASQVRRDACATRRKLELPQRYFLFVGRLVEEKGVFELLRAYATLDITLRSQIGLVFVGDGPSRHQLEEEARNVAGGTVKFTGFTHREELPAYYSLAEMLLLPTYTDTWGLVVNEAMACGLPAIVSRVAGCVADLVREGWNGLVVEPQDVSSLRSAMEIFALRTELRANMSAHALLHIAKFSPKVWSAAITDAIQAILGTHD